MQIEEIETMTTYRTIAESINFIVLDRYTREWQVAEGLLREIALCQSNILPNSPPPEGWQAKPDFPNSPPPEGWQAKPDFPNSPPPEGWQAKPDGVV